MTNITPESKDDANEIFQRTWIALEQEDDVVDPKAVRKNLGYVLLELTRRMINVTEMWRGVEIFEFDQQTCDELNQIKQYAIDMQKILMRSLSKLDTSTHQEDWSQEDGEFRKLLSDMAHEAVYAPVMAMAQLLLLTNEAGLENLDANERFRDLIARVTGLASYMESRFSISST